jgi:hypothetical protein
LLAVLRGWLKYASKHGLYIPKRSSLLVSVVMSSYGWSLELTFFKTSGVGRKNVSSKNVSSKDVGSIDVGGLENCDRRSSLLLVFLI